MILEKLDAPSFFIFFCPGGIQPCACSISRGRPGAMTTLFFLLAMDCPAKGSKALEGLVETVG